MLKELLVVCPRALGEDHSLTIIATNSYAVLLLGLERYAEAEPFLRKALAAGRRTEGADSRSTIITQLNLVSAVHELGQLDEAESLGRDALERFTRVFGGKHANTGTAHRRYADTLIKLGRNDEAMTHLVEAVAVKKGALGDTNPAFTGDALVLARLHLDAGRADAAEPILRDIEAVYAVANGISERRRSNTAIELGRCLGLQHHFVEAEPLLLGGHAVLAKTLAAGHAERRSAERRVAEFYAAWNAAEPDATRAAKAAEWQAKVDARN
jgi:tetratricopeptide (TPR) repeat protein